jgi:hypothetical protein
VPFASVGGMSLPDYYRILHVQPDAPAPIIHASYRTLVERAFGGTLGSAGLERATGTAPAHDEPAGSPGTRSCLFCGALHDLKRMLERDDECGRCLSPLYPAERHRLEYSGQRMLQRVPKQHTIHVWVTWPQDAPIRADMRKSTAPSCARSGASHTSSATRPAPAASAPGWSS